MTSGAGHYQMFLDRSVLATKGVSFENEEFGPADKMRRAERHLHLLLDENVESIFASTNDIPELAKSIGGIPFWFLNGLPKHQHLKNRMKGSVVPNNDVNW